MKSEEFSFRVKKDFTKQNVKVPLPKRFPKNKKQLTYWCFKWKKRQPFYTIPRAFLLDLTR